MLRKWAALAAFFVSPLIVTPAIAEAPTPVTTVQPVATVISHQINKPPRLRIQHVRFQPPAHPGFAKVQWIMRFEQKKWGGPTLANRISCESGSSWNALNGRYKGVLQFGPVWWSMWPGTPRKIRYATERRKRLRTIHLFKFTDGHTKRVVARRFTGIRRTIHTGMLPKNADQYHAWAAIRVGQRAVAGRGPTTSWECAL